MEGPKTDITNEILQPQLSAVFKKKKKSLKKCGKCQICHLEKFFPGKLLQGFPPKPHSGILLYSASKNHYKQGTVLT